MASRVGGLPRPAMMTVGGATDLGVMTAKLLGRAAGRGVDFAAKHPVAMTLGSIGGAGGIGVIRGSMASVRAAYPVPETNRALPPVQGPGYSMWAQRRGGMAANNLGATGDLTLAMHRGRHR